MDESIVMEPPPPIPAELHDRHQVLYGFKVSYAQVARYRERHQPEVTVPDKAFSDCMYKIALLRHIAQEVGVDRVTQYRIKARPRAKDEPHVDDVVYWAWGSYGVCNVSCPSLATLKEYAEKLGIEDEPGWHYRPMDASTVV